MLFPSKAHASPRQASALYTWCQTVVWSKSAYCTLVAGTILGAINIFFPSCKSNESNGGRKNTSFPVFWLDTVVERLLFLSYSFHPAFFWITCAGNAVFYSLELFFLIIIDILVSSEDMWLSKSTQGSMSWRRANAVRIVGMRGAQLPQRHWHCLLSSVRLGRRLSFSTSRNLRCVHIGWSDYDMGKRGETQTLIIPGDLQDSEERSQLLSWNFYKHN